MEICNLAQVYRIDLKNLHQLSHIDVSSLQPNTRMTRVWRKNRNWIAIFHFSTTQENNKREWNFSSINLIFPVERRPSIDIGAARDSIEKRKESKTWESQSLQAALYKFN